MAVNIWPDAGAMAEREDVERVYSWKEEAVSSGEGGLEASEEGV